MFRLIPIFWVALGVAAAGCAVSDSPEGDGAQDATPPEVDSDPADLVTEESGKADGWAFDVGDVIDDHLFEDAGYMSLDEVQGFLEATPYGRASFLATHPVGQRTTAEAIVDAAWRNSISPLVLLTKLQVEMALVGMDSAPSTRRVDFAMGCGCPDHRACSEEWRGLDKQIDCAAGVFRGYLDDLDEKGATVAGWAVGKAKRTLDPVAVTPANRATAALYTYTPWVLQGRGGNWLFWNIYRKYSRHFLDGRPNHRWIGGQCAVDEACSDPEGFCDGSRCTVACDKYCPDSRATSVSTSFCVEGRCVPRCDTGLFSDSGGCSVGFECVQAPRHNDPDTVQSVCLTAADASRLNL